MLLATLVFFIVSQNLTPLITMHGHLLIDDEFNLTGLNLQITQVDGSFESLLEQTT